MASEGRQHQNFQKLQGSQKSDVQQVDISATLAKAEEIHAIMDKFDPEKTAEMVFRFGHLCYVKSNKLFVNLAGMAW